VPLANAPDIRFGRAIPANIDANVKAGQTTFGSGELEPADHLILGAVAA
jgi:hypothetical protein